jgi:UDP-N-acetylmuramate dehydrogenase
MLMLKPEWELVRTTFGKRVLEREPLARYTTFRIGGPADLFVRAESREELIEITNAARGAGIPIFVLGRGSNILVADEGIRGLVIENRAEAFETREEASRLILRAESGISLPGLANRLGRQGWSGLEWSIGVPSTVGAAVVGNAGAHGGSVSDNLIRAEILAPNRTVTWWANADLNFAYRSSRFKNDGQGEIVLQAEFELRRDDPLACIRRMNQYTEHRRRTQPTDPSVGSMFKNPTGDYAGRLIEAAGLKGTRVGQVQVSPVHANFFVNRGAATAQDALQLVQLVRDRVKGKFGVELELEIQLVGQWD